VPHAGDHRIEVDRDAAPQVHRADVERAHVGLEIEDMLEPALGGEHERAHVRNATDLPSLCFHMQPGPVVTLRITSLFFWRIAVHDLAIIIEILARRAVFAIADVDMDDRGARFGCGQRFLRDMLA
jgi:hypothetical protein